MKRNWFLLLIALFLASLIAYRAYVLPITHDEASTWQNYRHLNVWSCLYNPDCWGTANNHWLNTLLLQWSAFFFGDMPWALRLPNVLAGIGYLICALLIVTRYIKNISLQCAGFILLCGHVYLLDFFSLARGYGMMASGVIWGMYSLLRYIEKYERRWLFIATSVLSFAVLANFTALLPWAVMGLGWFLWVLVFRKYSLLYRHGLIWLTNAVILFLLLHFPIKMLARSGEFGWGAKNIWEMVLELINNLLYGEELFGVYSSVYVIVAFCAFGLLIFGFSLITKDHPKRDVVLFTALLLALNFIVVVLHQKITGSLAPIGRKSIYLIPFLFGFFALGLQFIRNRLWGFFTGVLISLLFLYRIAGTAHSNYCREWYTDSNYTELFSIILPDGSSSDSIRLSSSWIFNPSLRFYQKTIPLPIDGLPYQRPLVIDSTMDYYYVETSDTLGMSEKGFVLDKGIGFFFLFRNSHSPK